MADGDGNGRAGNLEVAIDIGGTFTDFVFFDHDKQRLFVRKVPSTPEDPAAAVLDGLTDQDLGDYRRFVHATTVVINGILQRLGSVTALVTTAGFRGHIEFGDGRRYTGGLFDHNWVKEKPYPVPAPRRFVVSERMDAKGEPLLVPGAEQLAEMVESVRASGADAVAVCFINSYANPAHEELARDALAQALPEVKVFMSSDLPEFREYPRFITAVFNAFSSKRTSAYVGRLDPALTELGYTRGVNYMGSAGGVLTKDAVLKAPLNLLWGGIVGGVAAGVHLGKMTGVPNAVTFDMGGTSTDVALITDHAAQAAAERTLGAFPLILRQVDVASIGAGGGSIAWIDDDGALKVGPRSAGADPGPACYGRGGTDFTITDANLLLGRLGAGSLLSGSMRLDEAASMAAAEKLGAALGIEDPIELAGGVLEIANTNLDGAIREVSVERGENPGDLALIAFGGAGPMHGCEVAQRLEMRTVLVPRDAGNFSAWGLLASDERRDYVRSFVHPLFEADLAAARRLFEAMEEQGRRELTEAAGLDGDAIQIVYQLDMRYIGQAYVEELKLTDLEEVGDPNAIGEIFRAAYLRRYGYDAPIEMVEIASLRLIASGVTDKSHLVDTREDLAEETVDAGDGHGTRSVHFDSWHECQVYDRAKLTTGTRIAGPAILEEYDSTVVLPPGWEATTDVHGNLRLEMG
jgi:N-methylhydantoinase A